VRRFMVDYAAHLDRHAPPRDDGDEH
jgi:hypothetical protein